MHTYTDTTNNFEIKKNKTFLHFLAFPQGLLQLVLLFFTQSHAYYNA